MMPDTTTNKLRVVRSSTASVPKQQPTLYTNIGMVACQDKRALMSG